MKKGSVALVVLAVGVVAFLAGARVAYRDGAHRGGSADRKVLYYVDPMHPSYKSDKPGIAPDCGMQLEPVYADGAPGTGASDVGPPGTVIIPQEKRQAVGVRMGTVEKAPWTGTVRLLGKVVPDEGRTYKITAASDFWIRKVYRPTTNSFVRKDQPLAAYFTSGFLAAASNFLYAVDNRERHKNSADVSAAQAKNLDYQMRQAVANLINMGVSESQIQEMEKTGKASQLVEVRSPADGFILQRSVSVGQFVPAGNEMYTIADLDRVWILAETYENQGRLLVPGTQMKVTHPQKQLTVQAKVTEILPQFDPRTRTMQVRLEAPNPGYELRPDMFVDLEIPVRMPPVLTVPADAVLDTGTRATVYVDRGEGRFEPRKVETGARLGDRVQISKGLMEGERVVVSGTFLVDSESRMKLAASGIYGSWQVDPVCGMEVDEGKAKAASRTVAHAGQTYYFCSDGCVREFRHDPSKFVAGAGGMTRSGETKGAGPGHAVHGMPAGGRASVPARPVPAGVEAALIDPVCGAEVDAMTARTEVGVRVRDGKTYYFCSDECKDRFDADPARYISKSGRGSAGAGRQGHGHDAHAADGR